MRNDLAVGEEACSRGNSLEVRIARGEEEEEEGEEGKGDRRVIGSGKGLTGIAEENSLRGRLRVV